MADVAASVIIPTFNRKDSLLRTLASLGGQRYPAGRLEVIVVDDGGSDGTEGVGAQAYPFSLRYLRQENRGEVAARNAGAAMAAGDFLLFLDDDICVEADYIAHMCAALADDARTVALGTLYPARSEDDSPFKQAAAEGESRLACRTDVTFVDCYSGILGISRTGFFEVGMMLPLEPNGRNPWGGIDFGYRAHRLGYRFIRATSAIAYHDDRALDSAAGYRQRWYNVARAAVLLFQRYPELSDTIPMLVDKQPARPGAEPLGLTLRKAARAATASGSGLWLLSRAAAQAERTQPTGRATRKLGTLLNGAYMRRGFQAGLRDYGSIDARAETP